jgi:hypothetical protein
MGLICLDIRGPGILGSTKCCNVAGSGLRTRIWVREGSKVV